MNCAPMPSTVVEMFDVLGEVEKLPVKKMYQPLAVHMAHSRAITHRKRRDVVVRGGFIRANEQK